MNDRTDSTRGFFAAVGAFFIWGLFPLYLKALAAVSALEILVHRAAWCCLFVLLWLAWQRRLGSVKEALLHGPTRLRLTLSSLFISINWLVYAIAVNSGHVIETSLGYFINPLVSVLLGVVVLRERLNAGQWLAVSFATVGVIYLTWQAGRLPWISLALAVSFGLYGLMRKLVTVDSVAGLASETLILFPFSMVALIWLGTHDQIMFGKLAWHTDTLLVASGIITAVPLALFAYGARNIPLSTVGLIQYLAPSLQLALGVFVYREPMPAARLIGFCFIWLALLIYAIDGLWRSRRMATA